MSTPTLIVLLVGSNAACLALGFLFGRLTGATLRIEEKMTATPDAPAEKAARPAWGRQRSILVAVALAVALIGIVTSVAGYQITRNQDRLAGCVAGYSNALSDALTESRAAQNVVNEQLDNFMQAVLDAFSTAPDEGRQKVLDAVAAYVDARANAKQVQKDHPLPEAPRDACSELVD